MRICHVIEATGGGSALCVIQLVEAQLNAGHDVTLIYAPARADQQFLQSLPGLKGLKFIELPMRRSVGLADGLAVLRLAILLMRHGPYDIIHGHSSKAGALVRIAGLLFPRTAKVYTPHAFVTLGAEGSKIYALIERILGKLGQAVIALSAQEQRHAVQDLALDKNKTFLVPNGITLDATADRAAARNKLQANNHDIVIGFVGRLVAQKNPQRALAAFAEVAGPNVRLVMIGDGPLAGDIDASIKVLGLQSQVSRLGHVAASSYMPGFDGLLCSSDYEGFAMIFLEALRAGVPIITTPVGGSDETALPSKTGYVSSNFSTESLAAALDQFLTLGLEDRSMMRQACLDHAQNFSLSKMAASTEQVYSSVMLRRAA